MKANARYSKKTYKTYLLKVNKHSEKAVIEKLEQVQSKNAYIKDLIKKDIGA